MDSTSTLQNASPIAIRHNFSKLNRYILHVPDIGSKTTINSTFGSQVIESSESDKKRSLRPRRILSSIASSCDEPNKSQSMLNKIRESKSLDLLPVVKPKQLEVTCRLPQISKRSTKSLENCENCGEIQIIAIPDNKFFNNNFPNGNVISVTQDEHVNSKEDVNMPLLYGKANAMILPRKRFGSGFEGSSEEQVAKRWRSLESVSAMCAQLPDNNLDKKSIPRHSIKSWFVGLFNGNGLKASNTSLRKGGLNEYNNLQAEKESIV